MFFFFLSFYTQKQNNASNLYVFCVVTYTEGGSFTQSENARVETVVLLLIIDFNFSLLQIKIQVIPNIIFTLNYLSELL